MAARLAASLLVPLALCQKLSRTQSACYTCGAPEVVTVSRSRHVMAACATWLITHSLLKL